MFTGGRKSEVRSLRFTKCRVRKQRCLAVTSPLEAVEILKCRRCLKLDIACSFEIEPRVVPEPEPGPTRLAQHVVDLQKQ